MLSPASKAIGRKSCASPSSHAKPAGSTPITTYGSPSRLSVRPSTSAIRAEPGAPEGIGEDDPPMGAPDLVATVEPAAQGRARPQDGEHIRGDDGGLEPLGLIASGEHHRAVVVGADAGEAPLTGADLVEVGRRAHEGRPALEQDGLHLHQLVGVPVGQRAQQHRAGDAEHRRVRADAQREREERDRGESGRLEEASDREPDLPARGAMAPGTATSVPGSAREVRRLHGPRDPGCPHLGRDCPAPDKRHTGTAKSRSAWLSDVFRSVLSDSLADEERAGDAVGRRPGTPSGCFPG